MINIFPILFFIFLNLSYFYILKFFNFNEIKGIGFFISLIPLISFYINFEISNFEYYFIFYTIIASSLIYLLDDLFGLNPFIRILIQFISGFIILMFFFNLDYFLKYYLLISILLGFWNIFLTNVINFNDGNDGNVGFLILSLSICLLFYNFSNEINNYIIFYLFLFIIIFLFFNFYLTKFYFGDSGCFAFSMLINYLLIIECIINKNYFFLVFLFPLIFLSIDVIFVILYRIIKGQDLLKRNYLHLYQQIQIKYGGYYYLLINIFMPIILVIINYLLFLYFDNIFYLFLINFIILSILYFMVKYFFKL